MTDAPEFVRERRSDEKDPFEAEWRSFRRPHASSGPMDDLTGSGRIGNEKESVRGPG